MDDLENLNIRFTRLSKIPTGQGNVFHFFKSREMSDDIDTGEVYFSAIAKNEFRGFKRHKIMRMRLVVPCGHVELSFINLENKHATKILIGEDNYGLLEVPPLVWFGFRGVGEKNLLANLANIEHDPLEFETKASAVFSSEGYRL